MITTGGSVPVDVLPSLGADAGTYSHAWHLTPFTRYVGVQGGKDHHVFVDRTATVVVENVIRKRQEKKTKREDAVQD